MQTQSDVGLHWFDPFGTTDFQNLVSTPAVDYRAAKKRILFWDQEPLHIEEINKFLEKFINEIYRVPRFNHHYPIILVTSEYDSETVQQVSDTYNIQSSYYFFHAWAALDWYRGYDHSFLSIPFSQRNPKYTFLCPNNIIGGRRKHRLELLSELVDRELVSSNLISFPNICPYENRTVAELCKEYQILMGSVDLPLVIDRNINHANNSHKIDMWKLADQSLLHVVTETVYYGRKSHLTEKTFKPIVMQQPFMIVSCRGSLEYLRRYGFKTFDLFWDESYDDVDDNLRIIKIGKVLSDLNQLSSKEKAQLQRHLVPTVEHNFRWFYSKDFENLLWKEMTGMISRW